MHLALINIAKARFPMDDPRMSGFVNNLNAVNAAADRSDGFVWRLIEEGAHDATGIASFDDPGIIVNMAVWENIEVLENYVCRTIHKAVFARRNEWFERMDGPYMALWWVKEGTTPSVEEGKRRLRLLADKGPCFEAFMFGAPYSETGKAPTTD